jgi:hypothetical protein
MEGTPNNSVQLMEVSMIEMALLKEVKDTENKVRWDAKIDCANFELYIPKWRVPEPWPSLIHVTILPYDREQLLVLSKATAYKFPESRKSPIITHLKRFKEHTKTIRYQPEGDITGWEIGEPYIPIPMTYDGADRLTITVQWA